MKHFIDIADHSVEVIKDLVQLALEQKKHKQYSTEFKNKILGLIFEKPSLRTRVSFEVGFSQLGGQSITLKQDEIGLDSREKVEDVAKVLSRYIDIVMIRTHEHQFITRFANAATIPVINGLTNKSHPCQAMADILTIYENFNQLNDLKVVYFGDPNNVSYSLSQLAGLFNFTLVLASPNKPKQLLPNVSYEKDPNIAVKGADVLYTDTWVSMGEKVDKNYIKSLGAYQINNELLATCSLNTIILHCLPAYHDKEITTAVLNCEQSKVFDQAENRLHAQKAIMLGLLS
tara:strand:+ start:494 stop:1357 length:864 start_codon:yes stop_codon:yes gene_type:complete